jgi:DHA1 family tetracycline resistance protein-like MFS transporter
MQNNLKNALFFVLITIAIDSIGLGIIIPSLPDLVAETAHVTRDQSTQYYKFILVIYAAMQFLFSPLIGNLSDRYGRRPILLMSVLGLGLDYVFMFFAPDIWWLVVGRALSGMFGASFTTAAAYIADISTNENRAQNFGLIGAAFGIGFIIGPAIGGLVASWGLRAPFAIAAGLSLLNFVYGFIILKESLPADERRSFDWKRANPLGAVLQLKKFARNKYLFLVLFLVLFANMAVHALWNYYTHKRFDWSKADIGISLAVVGVCVGIVQAGLAGKIIKRLGERGAATMGLIILMTVSVVIGLIPYGWMMYLSIIPYAFSGIIDPSIRTLVSAQTKNNEQGELQGIFTSLMSLAEIFGPLMMLSIYASSIPWGKNQPLWYGTAFYVAGFIVLCALILLRWTLKKSQVSVDDVQDESFEE